MGANTGGALDAQGGAPGLLPGVRPAAVLAVLASALGISTAYGMLLLLPLYVLALGGSEAGFGLVLSAAVVPAALALMLLSRHPEALRPQWVQASAIAVFGVTAAATSTVREGWEPLVAVGVLLGTAWAVVYTVMPMVVNEMVTDSGRVTYFGYLTGTQQVGIGTGPVLAGWLVTTSLGFRGTFVVAGLVCAAAVVATVVAALLAPDRRGTGSGSEPGGSAGHDVGLLSAAGTIARSPVGPWLVVIALFACLFTTMTQFQTTFAGDRGLDYSVFYVAYTVAVIAVRFVVAPWVRRFDQTRVIAVAITVMLAAVASFLAVGSDPLAYATASAAMGLGYGLALPATQAHAVAVSPESTAARVLPVAGLVFQVAILGFPVVVGWMVVSVGYGLLFAVLVAFASAQALIAWRQVAVRRRGSTGSAPGS
ncbi:MFS transporter [Nocardioides sp. S-58]|uniref:MFS transporter n=1 Tax=Nocardioides renjunii TaxID=3095075 RepID=A0ABU5KGJ6_9ACTN|nr:MFS transporter [Nocardioides sp. S-58]MDZ5663579.1 MFS transporter [Nocardioides sp. S-58]